MVLLCSAYTIFNMRSVPAKISFKTDLGVGTLEPHKSEERTLRSCPVRAFRVERVFSAAVHRPHGPARGMQPWLW